MAWGYWNATTVVSDRSSRSPRRSNPQEFEEEEEEPAPLSRRPSLVDIEFTGPGVVCPPPPPPRAIPPPAVLPLARHDCYLHHSAAIVHHHQCTVHNLSPSDDEDPVYASGTCNFPFVLYPVNINTKQAFLIY